MYKVNKEKCIGCGLCVANCPEGIKIADDGKGEVTNQEKIKECGGTELCPYEAIEEAE